jgi:hypothetical protein
MALGVPAKIKENAVKAGEFLENAKHYVELGKRYRLEQKRID